jgi:HAE1 family hydrophobic/amphiphilic exporter-1
MRQLVTWLTEFSFRRAGIIALVTLLVSAYGLYSMTRINQELIPDINFPILTVIVQSPGDQPEQVVQNAIAPIEAASTGIPGMNDTESTTVAGFGVILYTFDFGTSTVDAKAAVQEVLDGIPFGPNIETSILAFDPASFPVVVFDLQGDLSQAELSNIAQGIVVPELMGIDGVGSVQVVGGAVNEIEISLNREQMLQMGIAFEQVAGALTANNVVLPSGEILTDNVNVPIQTLAIYRTLEDIENLPIQTSDGSFVSLSDFATVEQIEGRSVGRSRTNGEPSVSIQVVKTRDANTVNVSNQVIDKLNDLNPTLPGGASISILENQAEYIEESIAGVIEKGLVGGALAIVIVFVFLWNFRSTLITAVSLPLSMLMAIAGMYIAGYTLNIMTLAGLTIAIGRVIDDAIVVLENIYRHMAEGEETRTAVRNGAREVTLAIVGATATTCAVFLPIGLVGGFIGVLFLPFALAVVFALVASLLVAVTVIPMMIRFTIAGKVKVEPEKRAGDTFLGRLYTPVLKWSLKHRWTTLIIAAAFFIGSMALVPLLDVAFLPDDGENTIAVQINARPGETQEAVLQQAIAIEELLGNFDVERYQTVITGASGDLGAIANILSGNDPNSASMTVTLAQSVDRQEAASELRDLIANQVPNSENVSVSAVANAISGTGVAISITGATPDAVAKLPEFTAQVAEAVASVDDIANVSSNISTLQPTVQVLVDPARAAEYGLTPAWISSSLRNLSVSQVVTMVALDNGQFPVRLVVENGEDLTADELGELEIVPGVRLDQVATLQTVDQQVSINRVNGHVASSVTADITSSNTGGVSAEVQMAVDKLAVPDGVEVLFGGVAGDIDEGFSQMFIAILISIFLVYGIMAALFKSWLDPFVILFTLPLAAIGAIIALLVSNTPLSISVLIGVLMLVGIVVTNAIVMLEFVIMLRKEQNLSTYDALVLGAQTRLRPILMTALATMLALVPLSIGLFGDGALIAADLGRTVVGGLFTSTLLTLVVVPAVYSLVDDMKHRFGHGESPSRA